MPTYEYFCPEGHLFDKFQKMTDKPRARCPTCGKAATRKISGGSGLVFKGSGFYITDYGKDGKGPRKDTDKPAAESKPDTPSKADKTESKPAKEPAAKAGSSEPSSSSSKNKKASSE
jgi:putative FmdB family regulatory protein